MRLYLVMDGYCSDRSLVALLSDPALAERLAAHLPDGAVVPFVLDADATHLRQGLLPYLVYFHPDGSLDCCGPLMPDADESTDPREGRYVWALAPVEPHAWVKMATTVSAR